MAAFRHSVAALLLCICLISASAQEMRARPRPGEVEQFESDSFQIDRATNSMTFEGFRVYGENWSLTAGAAIAGAGQFDFESGEWRFEGGIDLQLDTASLQADSATFVFRDKRFVRAELSGSPMSFVEAAAADNDTVFGSAETLRYDDAAQTFELLGGVSLTVGPYRTTGCNLIYYLGQEEFTTGSAECTDPFVTTIEPPQSTDSTVE